MVEINTSKIHGRGVFALTNIPKGTELICDVILFNNSVKELYKWSFPWDKNYFSICMGFGSFFNHSDLHNVKIKKIDKNKLTKTFELTKDVVNGEELFLNYGKHFTKNINEMLV